MNPLSILKKYYPENSRAYHILLGHSQAVAAEALHIAEKFPEVDKKFVEEAALLHDIGIFKTHAPEIECHGSEPYIRHGILGREILEEEGLPKHALICERHMGGGIDLEQIREKKLPLPNRDMCPQTLEEEIVAYADKFFSKDPGNKNEKKSLEEIINNMKKYSENEVTRFLAWHDRFKN